MFVTQFNVRQAKDRVTLTQWVCGRGPGPSLLVLVRTLALRRRSVEAELGRSTVDGRRRRLVDGASSTSANRSVSSPSLISSSNTNRSEQGQSQRAEPCVTHPLIEHCCWTSFSILMFVISQSHFWCEVSMLRETLTCVMRSDYTLRTSPVTVRAAVQRWRQTVHVIPEHKQSRRNKLMITEQSEKTWGLRQSTCSLMNVVLLYPESHCVHTRSWCLRSLRPHSSQKTAAASSSSSSSSASCLCVSTLICSSTTSSAPLY